MSPPLLNPHTLPSFESVLGPAGRGGRRCCPVHGGDGPTAFEVKVGKGGKEHAKCHRCGWFGDIIDLFMTLHGISYAEALEMAGQDPSRRRLPVRQAAAKPKPVYPNPEQRWREVASNLVAEGEKCLWSKRGEPGLSYLSGTRGLEHDTIRRAKLGFNESWRPVPELARPEDEKPPKLAPGILFPWFGPQGIIALNVRRLDYQPGDELPKYLMFRGSERGGAYPSLSSIQFDRPLIIVEGEVDALTLGQAVDGLASVATIGSAGAMPAPAVRARLLMAQAIFAAHDNDEAGDVAAAKLGTRIRRERPPGSHKDWADAASAGLNLREWWLPILGIADEREVESAPPVPPMDPAVAAALSFMDAGEVESWQERAGDLEFDGGLPRTEAERDALLQVRPDLHSKAGFVQRGEK